MLIYMWREGIIASGAADDAIRFFVEDNENDGLVYSLSLLIYLSTTFSVNLLLDIAMLVGDVDDSLFPFYFLK